MMRTIGEETALEAYFKILPSLGRRQQAVFRALLEYVQKFRRAPTSQEVASLMSKDRSSVSNRLSELAKKGCVHQAEKRRCTQTGNTAETWELGEGLHGPVTRKEEAIRVRLATLLAWVPAFREAWDRGDRQKVAYILGHRLELLEDILSRYRG